MNLEKFSKRLAIDERTIANKLSKAGYNVINGSEIPDQWIAFVCQEYKKPRANRAGKTNRAAKDILKGISASEIGAAAITKNNSDSDNPRRWTWPEIFAALPLPLIGVVAAYGVWSLAGYFVPGWMQWVEAVAVESVYISLAALSGLTGDQKKLAKRVSIGALAVSAVYGSIAACFHIEPDLFEQLKTGGKISLAVLHGIPFPLLAYSIANLLLHKGN